jgi:hypothetical protein
LSAALASPWRAAGVVAYRCGSCCRGQGGVCIAIADGKKTLAQVRREAAASMAKTRSERSDHGNSRKSLEARANRIIKRLTDEQVEA